jgi:hypothetical protein
VTTNGATISWNTDTNAIGQVEYGTSTAYGTTTTPDAVASTVHSMTLTGLSPMTVYHFAALSTNGGGQTITPDQTFTTLAAPVGPHVDGQTSANGRSTVSTPALTTGTRDDLLIALVSADGPGSGQSATVSGGGLTWTRVKAQAVQPGASEVWSARASGFVTGAVFTATLAKSNYDVSLTVVAFSGAAGVGSSAGASAKPGAPSVSLVTTTAGSLVYGAGNDWDAAVARTPVAGQAIVNQWLDTAAGDTMWSQGTQNAVPKAGTSVAFGDSAPTNDRFNIVAVEITSTTGGATLQSISLAQATAQPGSFRHAVHYAAPDEASTDTTPRDKRLYV